MTKGNLVLLSAGGTGGHMTPAQALAQDLKSRGFDIELITDERGAKYRHLFGDMKVHVVRSGTFTAGTMGKLKGAANLGVGFGQALMLILKLKPKLVVGFGGYPSVPGVYAAQKLGISTVIHEQNAIIGNANAFLARKAGRIALSLPVVQGLDDSERMRAIVTGNPVRPEIAALYTQPYPNLGHDTPLRIFVMGGSLGAKVFGNIVPQTLAKLSVEYRQRLYIAQQCRQDDMESVRRMYEIAGIKADLRPFFDDVAGELARTHLIIGRSGASTVAEVTTAGRPAIFVPYPHHKDQQQKMNADTVADAGGAWVMTEDGFTPDALLARIETFLQNPSILFRAAEKARECGKPDAARKLGNLVTAMVSGWGD
ncbi:MAG: undecaprenyldiphospho-muramoylpentapeptide beta-N-acetylglucosaminyltransferase [Alphaproteobacteria bacterium]